MGTPAAKTLTTVARLALERVENTILAIQRYSFDEEPRLRTNIFLRVPASLPLALQPGITQFGILVWKQIDLNRASANR